MRTADPPPVLDITCLHQPLMQQYDAVVRTTLSLSPRVHAGLTELAQARGQRLSVIANDLLYEGLFGRDLPDGVYIDPVTGLAKVVLNRQYTMDEIADMIDEDA